MTTALTYDDYRFWLTRLVTERDSVSGNTAATMQDLTYTRDRVGNITAITDDAQDTLYFNNSTVTADQTFVYDGMYRLTAATGREKDSLGQPGAAYSGGTGSIPQAAGSMRLYRQEYDYDEAGNIIQMVHSAGPGTGGTTFWRRVYAYEDDNNQLIANSKPGESVTKTRAELQADPSSVDLTELNDTYAYNDRGAMTFLPHLDTSGSTNVTRDFRDQIRELAVGTSAGTAHYAYDAGGIRVAKLWDKSGAAELRVYIGSYEVFRSASSVSGLSSPSTELHTLASAYQCSSTSSLKSTSNSGSMPSSGVPLKRSAMFWRLAVSLAVKPFRMAMRSFGIPVCTSASRILWQPALSPQRQLGQSSQRLRNGSPALAEMDRPAATRPTPGQRLPPARGNGSAAPLCESFPTLAHLRASRTPASAPNPSSPPPSPRRRPLPPPSL